ncbi:MAG: TRAP transporter small permease [Pseudorhodoplanes sp.]|nr:TRAP transporter small permease [Pseudorhodoplanes sp.]
MQVVTPEPHREPTFLAWYGSAMRFFAGTSMLAIVVIMIVQVFARYVLNSSLIWAEEMCRYILIWQSFLLIGIAYHRGELVVLDVLSGRVSPTAKFLIRLTVAIPVCYFLYLLIVHGIVHAGRFKAQTIPAIDFIWTSLTGRPAHVPIFWVYVSVPVGCAILLIHYAGSIAYDGFLLLTGKNADPVANP